MNGVDQGNLQYGEVSDETKGQRMQRYYTADKYLVAGRYIVILV